MDRIRFFEVLLLSVARLQNTFHGGAVGIHRLFCCHGDCTGVGGSSHNCGKTRSGSQIHLTSDFHYLPSSNGTETKGDSSQNAIGGLNTLERPLRQIIAHTAITVTFFRNGCRGSAGSFGHRDRQIKSFLRGDRQNRHDRAGLPHICGSSFAGLEFGYFECFRKATREGSASCLFRLHVRSATAGAGCGR